jgi:hypothetical protein
MAKFRIQMLALIAYGLLPVGFGSVAFAQDQQETQLNVEIRSQLDFSRAATAGAGGGLIRIDPDSGAKQLDGELIDLGGSSLAGSAIIKGEPGRTIRIDMPLSIRMTGSSGGTIEVTNLRTNLPAQTKLDAFGQLEFSFGGDLRVAGNVAGTFRGRIPITAEYE